MELIALISVCMVGFFFLLLITRALSAPLADLSDPQDVGEKGFLVPDDHRLFQVPTVQEVFGQNAQGSKVRGLRCQNLKHTLRGSRRDKVQVWNVCPVYYIFPPACFYGDSRPKLMIDNKDNCFFSNHICKVLPKQVSRSQLIETEKVKKCK